MGDGYAVELVLYKGVHIEFIIGIGGGGAIIKTT